MADSSPPPPDPPRPPHDEADLSEDLGSSPARGKLIVRNPSTDDVHGTPPTPASTSTFFSPITPHPPQTPVARPTFTSPLQYMHTLASSEPNSPATSQSMSREPSDEDPKLSSVVAEVGSDAEAEAGPSSFERHLDPPLTPSQAAEQLVIPSLHQEATATARAIQKKTLPRTLPRGQRLKGTPGDRESISPRRATRDDGALENLGHARDVLDLVQPGHRSAENVHYPHLEIHPDQPDYEAARRERLNRKLVKYPEGTYRKIAADLNTGASMSRRMMADADPGVQPRVPLRRASARYADRYRPSSWAEKEARPISWSIRKWAAEITEGTPPNNDSPGLIQSAFSDDSDSNEDDEDNADNEEDPDPDHATASTDDLRQPAHAVRPPTLRRSTSAPSLQLNTVPSRTVTARKTREEPPTSSRPTQLSESSAQIARPEERGVAEQSIASAQGPSQSSLSTSQSHMSAPSPIARAARLSPFGGNDIESVPGSVGMERSPVNLGLLRPRPFGTAPPSPFRHVAQWSPFTGNHLGHLAGSTLLERAPSDLTLPPAICPPAVSFDASSAPAQAFPQRRSFVFHGRGRIPRIRPLQLLDLDGNPIESPVCDANPAITREPTAPMSDGSGSHLSRGAAAAPHAGTASAHSTPPGGSSRPATLRFRPGSAGATAASSTPATLVLRPPPGTDPGGYAVSSSTIPTATPAPAFRGRLLGDEFTHSAGPHRWTSDSVSDAKGKRRADDAALVCVPSPYSDGSHQTPPSASARRSALYKGPRAKSPSPTGLRVRFDDAPTPPYERHCEDQTPATQELETPSTILSDEVIRDPEAEMDALLVEQLAMENAERSGDDVTMWRQALELRTHLLMLQIDEVLGHSPDHHIARALFQTPPAWRQGNENHQRDATPESAGPSGTSGDAEDIIASSTSLVPDHPPPERVIFDQGSHPLGSATTGQGISEEPWVEQQLTLPSAASSSRRLAKIEGPQTRQRTDADSPKDAPSNLHDEVTRNLVDTSPFNAATANVADGPSITLTSPTPVPVQGPQLESPFAVPDFPLADLGADFDRESNVADDRLGNPTRAGGWRRRASWALGTGSFEWASVETGLLPSPLGPRTERTLEEHGPLRIGRPALRRNGFTMPDLVEVRRMNTVEANMGFRSASVSEDLWPFHAPQPGFIGAELGRSFLAELARNAVMRPRTQESGLNEGSEAERSALSSGPELNVGPHPPSEPSEAQGYDLGSRGNINQEETGEGLDRPEAPAPFPFSGAYAAPSRIPQDLVNEAEASDNDISIADEGGVPEIHGPSTDGPLEGQGIVGLPEQRRSTDTGPDVARPGAAANEDPASPARTPSEAGPTSPSLQQSPRSATTPAASTSQLSTPGPSTSRRDRARRPKRPIGLDEEARIPEPTGSSTLIDDVPRRQSIYEARRPAPSPPTNTARAPTLPPIQSGGSLTGAVLPSPPPPVYTPPRGGVSRLPSIAEAFHRAGQYVVEHTPPRPRGPNPIINVTPPSVDEDRDSFWCDDPIDFTQPATPATPATPAAAIQTPIENFSPPDADLERGQGGEEDRYHGFRIHDRYEQVAGWLTGLLGKIMHWRGRRHDGDEH